MTWASRLLAREADGSLRDAESLLDQVVAWSTGVVTEQTVREALGVADRQALVRVVEAIIDRDPTTALRLAGDLYEHGYDPRRLCHDLLEHFRNVALVKVNPELASLTDLPDHEIAAVQRQAATRSLEDVQRLFTLTLRAEEDIQKTAYSQLVVEMTLVKLASQPAVFPIEHALAQLETLTRALNGQSSQLTPPLATSTATTVSSEHDSASFDNNCSTATRDAATSRGATSPISTARSRSQSTRRTSCPRTRRVSRLPSAASVGGVSCGDPEGKDIRLLCPQVGTIVRADRDEFPHRCRERSLFQGTHAEREPDALGGYRQATVWSPRDGRSQKRGNRRLASRTDQPCGSFILTTTTPCTITHTTSLFTAAEAAHGRRPLSENCS